MRAAAYQHANTDTVFLCHHPRGSTAQALMGNPWVLIGFAFFEYPSRSQTSWKR